MPEGAGELVELLQASISPIALISGVGLLLLSVTNRLARVIDRTRLLAADLRAAPAGADADRLRAQLEVLVRRAGFLWASIASVTVSVLCSCVMVLLLTAMVFFQLSLRLPVVGLFFVALLSLLVSALCFFGDVLMALRALRMEIGHL
jgi:hypothetical protein